MENVTFDRFVKFIKNLASDGMEIADIKTIIRDNFLKTEHTALTKGYINTNDLFPIFDAEYIPEKGVGNDCLVWDNIKKSELDEFKDLIKAVKERFNK